MTKTLNDFSSIRAPNLIVIMGMAFFSLVQIIGMRSIGYWNDGGHHHLFLGSQMGISIHFYEKTSKLVEKKVMSGIYPLIQGDADISYEAARRLSLWESYKPFTDGITNPKPGFYDGARPEQLDQRVRNDYAATLSRRTKAIYYIVSFR
jgi:hypothetical protein